VTGAFLPRFPLLTFSSLTLVAPWSAGDRPRWTATYVYRRGARRRGNWRCREFTVNGRSGWPVRS
jgi:hypothetical protein